MKLLRGILPVGCLLISLAFSAQGQPPPAVAPPAVLHLLRVQGAELTVSSQVENPRDVPANLVDGNLETAWSSRTGLLEGTEIDFRVPTDCTVQAIEMTVGMTRAPTPTGGDLFTMNPRISGVRVFREGALVRDFPLDPQQRGLQSLALGTQGGLYRVVVTRVQPGTRADWREVSISEFRVVGTRPGVVPSSSDPVPVVRVGALFPTALPTEAYRTHTTEALPNGCFAWSASTNTAACTTGAVGHNIGNEGESATADWSLVFSGTRERINLVRREDVEAASQPLSGNVLRNVQSRMDRGFVSLAPMQRSLARGSTMEVGTSSFRLQSRATSGGGRNVAPRYSEQVQVRWRANEAWQDLTTSNDQPGRHEVSIAAIPGDRWIVVSAVLSVGDEGMNGRFVSNWRCDTTVRRCDAIASAR